MNQNIKDVEVPTLTLDPEERPTMNFFNEPSMEAMHVSTVESETGVRAGSVDESMLSEEEKRQVENFVKQIDITNVKMVNSYGASAQNSISAFSTSITSNVKTKEFAMLDRALES